MLQFNKPIDGRVKKLFKIALGVSLVMFVIAILFPIVMFVIAVLMGVGVFLTD